jgi:filamentous hemagglutinin family protein
MRRLCSLAVVAAALTSSVYALPDGPQPVSGQTQVTQPQQHILQILQSSPQAILNWNSFNIAHPELVQFLQPNAQAVILNRVTGQNPSEIFGRLEANGRVFLVNPNGVLFGPDSSVNVGSFVVSTLGIQDADFLAGNYKFAQTPGQSMAAIVNQGKIQVGEGGFAVLLSPLLDNQGLIVAERGQVVLGATKQATLTVDAQGLLEVTIPDGFKGGQKESNPGTVLVTPAQMSDVLAQVVRAPGIVEAGEIVETPTGTFLAGAEGVLVQQGRIEANNGRILLNSSQATVHDSRGSLQADGGRIDVLSAGRTWSAGDIVTLNGFTEVSGQRITLVGRVEVGPNGTLLIDPGTLRIVAGGGSLSAPPYSATGSNETVSAATLAATSGQVILTADEDIILENGVVVNFNPGVTNVTLQAGRDIFLESGGQLNLNSGAPLSLLAGEDVLMLSGSSVSSTSPASQFIADGAVVDLQDVGFNNIRVQGGGSPAEFVRFAGTLGRPGAPTSVNVSAGGIFFAAGSATNIAGSSYNVDLTSSGDVILEAGSSLLLPAGAGNLTIVTQNSAQLADNARLHSVGPVNLTVQANGFVNYAFTNSSVTSDSSGSRAFFQGQTVDLEDIGFNTINANAPGTFARVRGVLGRPGAPTVVNVTSQRVRFRDNSATTVQGSTATLNLAGSVDVGTEPNAVLDFGTTPATLNASGGTFFMDTDSRITSAAPVSVNFTGARVDNRRGDVVLNGAGSSLALNTVNATTLGNTSVNGNVAVVSSAGNIRLHGPVRADDITLSSSLHVLGVTPDAELIPNRNLTVTANNIYGNFTQPAQNVSQALILSGSPGANITLNVNGPNLPGATPANDVAQPTVAALLFRRAPQNQNLTLNKGVSAGDVVIINEGELPPPLPPPVLDSKDDLTLQQQAELLQQLAQVQLQLGNLPPVMLGADEAWEPLSSTNAALLSFYPAPIASPTLEFVALSPADAETAEAQAGGVSSPTAQLVGQREEDETDLRFWRYMVEKILLWEEQ